MTEKVIEDETDNQDTEDIGEKINRSKKVAKRNFRVQSQSDQQTERIDENGGQDRIFESEKIGMQDVFVLEQQPVIFETDEIVSGSVAVPVRE
jgi:hypothetical protein